MVAFWPDNTWSTKLPFWPPPAADAAAPLLGEAEEAARGCTMRSNTCAWVAPGWKTCWNANSVTEVRAKSGPARLVDGRPLSVPGSSDATCTLQQSLLTEMRSAAEEEESLPDVGSSSAKQGRKRQNTCTGVRCACVFECARPEAEPLMLGEGEGAPERYGTANGEGEGPRGEGDKLGPCELPPHEPRCCGCAWEGERTWPPAWGDWRAAAAEAGGEAFAHAPTCTPPTLEVRRDCGCE